MTRVVTSPETSCRSGTFPFYLRHERQNMCGKECLKDLLTDCLDERMYDWNDARMEYCTQAVRNV